MWWGLLFTLISQLIVWLLKQRDSNKRLAQGDRDRIDRLLGKFRQVEDVAVMHYGCSPTEDS